MKTIRRIRHLKTGMTALLLLLSALAFAQVPANDLCTNPTALNGAATTCTNVTGNLRNSTPTVGMYPSCSNGGTISTGTDVWYQFTASTAYPTFSFTATGSTIRSTSNGRFALYTGSCGTLTEVYCQSLNTAPFDITFTTFNAGQGLTPGTTYFVRIFSVTNTATITTNTTHNFTFCLTNPTASDIQYSKTYVNVSKLSTGGTIFPGDTLEMRATFVVRTNTSSADSISFNDTLYNGAGLTLVPGSIALRTNEGILYKGFTDSPTDIDAGWRYQAGSDTVIQMNLGTVASRFLRGRLNHNSRPSVFSATCIVMATYRVVVRAPFGSDINFRTGRLTFRDVKTGVNNSVTFTPSFFRVYSSPGLCPDAVSTNTIGAEFNGTFGTATNPAPLARNRAASPFTTYTYSIFRAGAGPNDYFYGIANNTSSTYTTATTAPKAGTQVNRVFNLWDISGDHTGAANPAVGNAPCDTMLPVSATNPCGYMLVVNSAYRTDTAFTYNVTNLCPNTYYEISGWFKNMCSKCGCDSLGNGSSSVSYTPAVIGDTAGVRPNIAFDVNGIDYYTTGDIRYVGTGYTTSDATNRWVKRGFVYLTGPSETSFNITFRNNAPGGGGNDWALDDIAVVTCLPRMSYSPGVTSTSCRVNPVELADTVTSFFPNYMNYQWQVSTNGGATWMDIAGAGGVVSPQPFGGGYRYIVNYTVTAANTQLANNGDLYRVITATTASNLTNASCQVTDGTSVLMNILDCGGPLTTSFISFNVKKDNAGNLLRWTTSREEEPFTFDVQRAEDGVNFKTIASLQSLLNYNAETNEYTFTDSSMISGKISYRILMRSATGKSAYSRIISLQQEADEFQLNHLVNPFQNSISFDLTSSVDARVEVTLMSGNGAPVKTQSFLIRAGVNAITLPELQHLSAGMYILQVKDGKHVIARKAIKR